MIPLEIGRALHAKPFVPFRLHLDDGRCVDVRTPDDAVVDALLVTDDVDLDGLTRRESVCLGSARVVRVETPPAIDAAP